MMNLKDFKDNYKNEYHSHKSIHELFTKLVTAHEWLNWHRTYVEQGAWGFGERSFHWLYNLVVQELSPDFKFLDIGVFRGQTVSLVSGLATNVYNKKSNIYALSTFMGHGLDYIPRDYHEEVQYLFDYSSKPSAENISSLTFITGFSEDAATINLANSYGPYDLILLDGGHEYLTAKSDIENYSAMCKIGGYMLIDDCCNSFNMPFGYFTGIDTVSRAVDSLLPPKANSLPTVWEFIGSVVHLRLYRRIK